MSKKCELDTICILSGLASNSLLEGLVYGAHAGEAAARAAAEVPTNMVVPRIQHPVHAAYESFDVADVRVYL